MVKVISYLSIAPLTIIKQAGLSLTKATKTLPFPTLILTGDKSGVHAQVMHRGQRRPVPLICTGVAKLSFDSKDYVC